MTQILETIDVDVPVTVAYDQWTQFETFPQFLEGVDEITQLSDRRMHWKISLDGVTREFDAEVTEQVPDERVAWKSVDGTGHAGVVTFHKLDGTTSRVALQLDTEPEGLVERVGDLAGVPKRAAKADLKRFKEFIESRGTETGAWRGEVPREG